MQPDSITLNGFEDVFGSIHSGALRQQRTERPPRDPGPDVLKGLAGDGMLVGMGGADEANGGSGTDRCRAELTANCES
jgi:hypothetical protein